MKRKNHTSHANRYILLGLSIFCALMMILSSFSDKVGGPFRVFANITVIPLQQGINHIGRNLTPKISRLFPAMDYPEK